MSHDYCPICGRDIKDGEIFEATPSSSHFKQHRCPERTLRGIDFAMKQEYRNPAKKTEAQRLNDGFIILELEM